jgi:6-pyruvoyltetrahydropterin/6-carboxytetrahydropterin synthase
VVAAGESLDAAGVVVDFEVLKQVVAGIAARFHYADINSHPDMAGVSPSAEVVARYFFEQTRQGMGEAGALLERVRVWEAPGCSATYAE